MDLTVTHRFLLMHDIRLGGQFSYRTITYVQHWDGTILFLLFALHSVHSI